MENTYPSQLLEKAVCEFSKLPGIGRKTALRLVLNMLRRSEEEVEEFAGAVSRLRKDVKYCRVCHNISDTEVCPICSDTHRDASTICVVENIRDVMAGMTHSVSNSMSIVTTNSSLPPRPDSTPTGSVSDSYSTTAISDTATAMPNTSIRTLRVCLIIFQSF